MTQLQLKQIGSFVKVHGVRGELLLGLIENITFESIDKIIKEGDAIFVETDGIPVPFFIAENGLKKFNQSAILVKFEDIDTKKAIQLVNSNVLIESSRFPKKQTKNIDLPSELIGYSVTDKNGSFEGEVIEFMDLKGNPMLNVKIGKKTMLLPVISDFMLSLDNKKKKIVLELPEGYLEAML